MRSFSDRRRRRDAVYPERRRQVYERSDARCEAGFAADCNGRCEEVHHRAGRGGPDPHALGNLVGCCAPCHRAIHGQPQAARAAGLMVSRHTAQG